MSKIKKAVAENAKIFLEHGPGLRYDYSIYVIARDPSKRMILLGGLGAMGIGQMWMKEADDCPNYIGYAEAPTVEAPDFW